jgi:predicted metallopeptidase
MPAYLNAEDIKVLVDDLVDILGLFYLDKSRIFCTRSTGAKTRSILARIHPLPSIYQTTLGLKPAYVIEAVSENFDRLTRERKTKVMIHELLHIPRNFSGNLKPHLKGFESRVDMYYKVYVNRRGSRTGKDKG